jgi:hypothetical protein
MNPFTSGFTSAEYIHRLKIELDDLDLQSFFGVLCTDVLRVSVLIGAETRNSLPGPSPPPHLGSYTRALLVSQDRRHLFVTPWLYRLNMKLDLQILFGLHVHRCTHWLRHRHPPPHLGLYTRALLVSQDRRHLFVTPWCVMCILL